METISDTFPQQASLHGCVIETPFGDFGKKKMIEQAISKLLQSGMKLQCDDQAMCKVAFISTKNNELWW